MSSIQFNEPQTSPMWLVAIVMNTAPQSHWHFIPFNNDESRLNLTNTQFQLSDTRQSVVLVIEHCISGKLQKLRPQSFQHQNGVRNVHRLGLIFDDRQIQRKIIRNDDDDNNNKQNQHVHSHFLRRSPVKTKSNFFFRFVFIFWSQSYK